MNLSTDGRIVSETPTTLVYDGENGVGQWIAHIASGHAIRLAASAGLGLVTVRDSGHIGMAAFWAQRMVEHGQIGLVFTNASPLVAPWQGRERLRATRRCWWPESRSGVPSSSACARGSPWIGRSWRNWKRKRDAWALPPRTSRGNC